jgi:hypothetical protein
VAVDSDLVSRLLSELKRRVDSACEHRAYAYLGQVEIGSFLEVIRFALFRVCELDPNDRRSNWDRIEKRLKDIISLPANFFTFKQQYSWRNLSGHASQEKEAFTPVFVKGNRMSVSEATTYLTRRLAGTRFLEFLEKDKRIYAPYRLKWTLKAVLGECKEPTIVDSRLREYGRKILNLDEGDLSVDSDELLDLVLGGLAGLAPSDDSCHLTRLAESVEASLQSPVSKAHLTTWLERNPKHQTKPRRGPTVKTLRVALQPDHERAGRWWLRNPRLYPHHKEANRALALIGDVSLSSLGDLTSALKKHVVRRLIQFTNLPFDSERELVLLLEVPRDVMCENYAASRHRRGALGRLFRCVAVAPTDSEGDYTPGTLEGLVHRPGPGTKRSYAIRNPTTTERLFANYDELEFQALFAAEKAAASPEDREPLVEAFEDFPLALLRHDTQPSLSDTLDLLFDRREEREIGFIFDRVKQLRHPKPGGPCPARLTVLWDDRAFLPDFAESLEIQ